MNYNHSCDKLNGGKFTPGIVVTYKNTIEKTNYIHKCFQTLNDNQCMIFINDAEQVLLRGIKHVSITN